MSQCETGNVLKNCSLEWELQMLCKQMLLLRKAPTYIFEILQGAAEWRDSLAL